MSCNTKTSLAAVIDAVNAQLNNNYVDRDDPRIDQGVFTEPTIRGGLMLDEAAKLDFCGYVTECGQREPFGKQWVDRPLYPDNMLVSYEDEGEIKSRWQDIDDVIDVTLRQDLANPDMGAAMIGRGVVAVDSIADLLALLEGQRKEELRYLVKGYYSGSDVGGGEFYWDSLSTEESDEGVVLGSGTGRFKRIIQSGALTPQMFGSIDGEDCTLAIQAAVDASESLGLGKVFIPDGTYWINGVRGSFDGSERKSYGVLLPSGLQMSLSENAVLKIIPNDSSGYAVFYINDASDVRITGGRLVGDKLDHTYDGSMEWGHGIAVWGSSNNVVIDGVTIRDMMGDGVYLRCDDGINNLIVKNNIIFDCRRHEITVTSVDGALIQGNYMYKTSSVRDGVVNSTYGGLNIDIEPSNSTLNRVRNIEIRGNRMLCLTNACIRSDTRHNNIVNLRVLENILEGESEGVTVNGGLGVLVSRNEIRNMSRSEGWGIQMKSVEDVQITDNTLYNCKRYIYVVQEAFRNSGITIHNNRITSEDPEIGTSVAVVVQDSDGVVVTNNIVRVGSAASTALFTLKNTPKAEVRDNILDLRGIGVTFSAVVDGVFQGNTLTNSSRLLDIGAGSSITVRSNSFVYPDVKGSEYYARQNGDSTCVYLGNTFRKPAEVALARALQLAEGATGRATGNDFTAAASSIKSGDLVMGGNFLVDGTFGYPVQPEDESEIPSPDAL